MKDIPIFTTEHGAAGLVLREIPYRGNAYVRLHASQEPLELARECARFCRGCGAERVYGTGHPALADLPLHTQILRLSRLREGIGETDAALWPVLPENVEQWRQFYNQRMADVANAAYMTASDGAAMLRAGDGYFVYRGEALLGIGRASGQTLSVVAALRPGAGRDVVLALCHALTEQSVWLETARSNAAAMRLYEKLGFSPVSLGESWYCL